MTKHSYFVSLKHLITNFHCLLIVFLLKSLHKPYTNIIHKSAVKCNELNATSLSTAP